MTLRRHAETIDPFCKHCIKGTRITVELILRKLGAGRTFADVLDAYPALTIDDIRAALAIAIAAGPASYCRKCRGGQAR
jgi:uncharacterized protein (DUF433 family)